jgi:hypothetical protein
MNNVLADSKIRRRNTSSVGLVINSSVLLI